MNILLPLKVRPLAIYYNISPEELNWESITDKYSWDDIYDLLHRLKTHRYMLCVLLLFPKTKFIEFVSQFKINNSLPPTIKMIDLFAALKKIDNIRFNPVKCRGNDQTIYLHCSSPWGDILFFKTNTTYRWNIISDIKHIMINVSKNEHIKIYEDDIIG